MGWLLKPNNQECAGERGRVGIISLYGWLKIWDNYGTLLQNFALQTFLQERGYSTFWIKTKSTPSNENRIASKGKKMFLVVKEVLRFLAIPFLGMPRSQRIARFNARHPRRFQEFMSRYTPTSSREYSLDELEVGLQDVDALIVGSDQVWTNVSRINFLDFGPAGALRIAYAVSAPWPALDADWMERARKFISRFDAISVREIEGLEVCKRLERNDAFHALDPVLLLDEQDYLDVVRRDGEDVEFSSATVLGYFVNLESIDQIPWEASVEFATNKRCELIAVPMQGAELVIPGQYLHVPTPSGWMNAFHKAECVVTNSYHGALFAVIMKKPFLVFLQGGVGSHQNVRFTSALKPLGLEGRILNVDEWRNASPDFLEEQMGRAIDWEGTYEKLNEWRRGAGEFLVTSLREIARKNST